jgi:ubiquinone/menaquinone biosynthesis C-methylase UbiE
MPLPASSHTPEYDKFLRELRRALKPRGASAALARWMAKRYEMSEKSAIITIARARTGQVRLGAEYTLAIMNRIVGAKLVL